MPELLEPHPDAKALLAVAKLPIRDNVALLLRQIRPVSPDRICNEVYEIFSKDARLQSLAVVDGERPVGLINRHSLLEHYSKLFFRDLYGKKPVSQIMEKSPLIVDKDMTLDDLSRILVVDGDRYLYDGVIITELGCYIGMLRAHDLMAELTRLKQAHLYHIAHHDMLSGLPNRQLFHDRLRHALAKSARSQHGMGILFIDLDHFKSVNDTLGHSAGDQLLVAVARRLEKCVRSSDTVARLGGDEFTVVLEEVQRPDDASTVAEKILQAMAEPFQIHGRFLRVSASIGISLCPEDGQDAEALVSHADSALYHAKESRNSYQFFQKSLHTQVMLRHAMGEELREALDKGELCLYYQPQVELASGRITGLEALLRWKHPVRGLIGPGHFIPLAEESGLIVQLGEWVFEEACRQARLWKDLGLHGLCVAVNISARQFKKPGFGRWALAALDRHGLHPSALELELTETAAMSSEEDARVDLELLREAGLRIAMDDFGTGYSSLGYLRSFSFDVLKIDRSFIKSLVSSPRDQAIARAILALAHSLGLSVVAEGVEVASQLDFLKAEGCDLIQGYLCCEPRPPEWIEALLLSGQRFERETLSVALC